MLSYPKICLEFDERISLLDFKRKDLNVLKNEILKKVNEFPEVTSSDLQRDMISKGFSFQIKTFINSNYSSRLNLDLKNKNDNKIDKAFEELIDLVDIRKINLSKNIIK